MVVEISKSPKKLTDDWTVILMVLTKTGHFEDI